MVRYRGHYLLMKATHHQVVHLKPEVEKMKLRLNTLKNRSTSIATVAGILFVTETRVLLGINANTLDVGIWPVANFVCIIPKLPHFAPVIGNPFQTGSFPQENKRNRSGHQPCYRWSQ